ncbi:MAG: elongation factor P [Sumerlaeia bacterium]
MTPIEPSKARIGSKLVIEGDVYNVVEYAHTKPGKGQAFVKVKVKSLSNGKVLERTYKIGEMLETADFERMTCQYLYNDADGYHFMNLSTYEQFTLQESDLGMAINFLQENAEVIGSFWNGNPIGIELQPKATFTVETTMDVARGNTANAVTKEAILNNGYELQVPSFIKQGEKIIVNTETGEYVERA